MKKYLSFVLLFMAASLGAVFTSCSTDEDNPEEYLAIATVIPGTGKTGCVLKVDKNTYLNPVNITTPPYDKESRAFIRYYKPENQPSNSTQVTDVQLTWMEKMLTKDLAENKGADNEKEYGDDGLVIYNDWCTVAEDGYLTLHFGTYFGVTGITHSINLVDISDAEHPYKYRLYHNANGDFMGSENDGFVSFKIFDRKDCDKDATIELEWKGFNGIKTAKFEHNPVAPVQRSLETPVVSQKVE